jgi:hypothetical protein
MIKNIFRIFSLAVFITSCTKVVNIDLNTTNPKLVIEGIISNKSNVQTVTISKTVNFSESNNFPKINNAVVTISDNNGTPVILNLTAPGVYQTTSIIPANGHTYKLNIQLDGNTYIASSTMPQPVLMDSLSFLLNQSFGGVVDTTYIVTPHYMDPANYVNYYKLAQTVNGKLDKTIHAFNDNLINGKENKRPLFSNDGDYKLVSGDSVKVELFGIDKAVYDYYYALSLIVATGGGPSATPANPNSNISGGVLGYFSAQTFHVLTRVIP